MRIHRNDGEDFFGNNIIAGRYHKKVNIVSAIFKNDFLTQSFAKELNEYKPKVEKKRCTWF